MKILKSPSNSHQIFYLNFQKSFLLKYKISYNFIYIFFKKLFCIEVQLINNVLVQQSDSIIHIHVSTLFQILFLFRENFSNLFLQIHNTISLLYCEGRKKKKTFYLYFDSQVQSCLCSLQDIISTFSCPGHENHADAKIEHLDI